jgi:NAD(P)-dependent dehydrogenase (short-subunit alcohol dehydrogenase family)
MRLGVYVFKENILHDKVVLITGGGTGLGKAMAREFAHYGAHVNIASRSKEHVETAAAEIGENILPFVCDIRKPTQVEKIIDQIESHWGHIDILINNAAGNFIAPAASLTPNGWKSVVDIVLNGSYYCSHFAGKKMIAKGSGKILNIIATYAWTGSPGTIHSASAKAGVLAMTRTLAVEWARYGIRVNAIAPGPVDTEGARKQLWAVPQAYEFIRNQIPTKRFGREKEVANAAVYLCSDFADYINGEVLVIDAGMWLNQMMFDLEAMGTLIKNKSAKKGESS